MVGIGRVEHSITQLALVGDSIAQVLALYVVLEGSQSSAGFVQPTHPALVVALPQFLDPLPNQVPDILCNKRTVLGGQFVVWEVLYCDWQLFVKGLQSQHRYSNTPFHPFLGYYGAMDFMVF